MTGYEWVQNEINYYQAEEKDALKRLEKARNDLAKAAAELAEAKEYLAGVRGGKDEFYWQAEYLKEHGRLP
jgi:chromosome segregation ATPase